MKLLIHSLTSTGLNHVRCFILGSHVGSPMTSYGKWHSLSVIHIDDQILIIKVKIPVSSAQSLKQFNLSAFLLHCFPRIFEHFHCYAKMYTISGLNFGMYIYVDYLDNKIRWLINHMTIKLTSLYLYKNIFTCRCIYDKFANLWTETG